jgi:hypothetical protein
MRARVSTEYTEKLVEAERQLVRMREELRKRDAQVQQLTNESLKSASDTGKRLALVE